jgi:hypothetical protein
MPRPYRLVRLPHGWLISKPTIVYNHSSLDSNPSARCLAGDIRNLAVVHAIRSSQAGWLRPPADRASLAGECKVGAWGGQSSGLNIQGLVRGAKALGATGSLKVSAAGATPSLARGRFSLAPLRHAHGIGALVACLVATTGKPFCCSRATDRMLVAINRRREHLTGSMGRTFLPMRSATCSVL